MVYQGDCTHPSFRGYRETELTSAGSSWDKAAPLGMRLLPLEKSQVFLVLAIWRKPSRPADSSPTLHPRETPAKSSASSSTQSLP